MPFKSDAQRKFFNANRDQLEAQGVNVDEWNKASKGKNLPARSKIIKPAKPPKMIKPPVIPSSPLSRMLGLK
jgi:hypothetical protein